MTLPPDRDPSAPTPSEQPTARDQAPPTVGEMLARVPPKVVGGILLVAAVVAVAVTYAVRPEPRATDTAGAAATDPAGAAARDSAATTDAAAFAFRLRGSRADGADCVMTFEVTAGTDAPWNITVDVMDPGGAVIARDSKQVPSLAPGLLTEFRFRNADCDRIDSWQFQGATAKPGGG